MPGQPGMRVMRRMQGDVPCLLGAAPHTALLGHRRAAHNDGHHEASIASRATGTGGGGRKLEGHLGRLHMSTCFHVASWLPSNPSVVLPALCLLPAVRVCSYRWVKTMWRQRAEVDCSKARSELGLSFIPLEQVCVGRAGRW